MPIDITDTRILIEWAGIRSRNDARGLHDAKIQKLVEPSSCILAPVSDKTAFSDPGIAREGTLRDTLSTCMPLLTTPGKFEKK